jgi:hypothetical protein
MDNGDRFSQREKVAVAQTDVFEELYCADSAET